MGPTKMQQNMYGTTAKMEADVSMQLGNTPLDMAVWVDANKDGFIDEE